MEYRQLGGSGFMVPILTLGTGTFGGGGEFFWEDIQRLLKEAKINAHLAAPSRQANALGQYIYGEAQLAASATRSAKV